MSDTPRTDRRTYWNALPPLMTSAQIVPADFARELELENAELNRKLDQILTDKNYEGGVQYWIRKHDALMLQIIGAREFGKAAQIPNL